MKSNLQLQCDDSWFNQQALVFERGKLEGFHGKDNVWTLEELQQRFEILGYMRHFCGKRQADRQKGQRGIQISCCLVFWLSRRLTGCSGFGTTIASSDLNEASTSKPAIERFSV